MLLFVFFRLANHVFGHYDSRINEHSDSDGDSSQRHDVRRDAVPSSTETRRARERKRNCDHKNAAKVPEKENVRQRDQNDFFNQCMAQCVYGMVDEDTAVIEGTILTPAGSPAESRRSSS